MCRCLLFTHLFTFYHRCPLQCNAASYFYGELFSVSTDWDTVSAHRDDIYDCLPMAGRLVCDWRV